MPRLGVALAAWLVMGDAPQGLYCSFLGGEPLLSRCSQALTVWNLQSDTLVGTGCGNDGYGEGSALLTSYSCLCLFTHISQSWRWAESQGTVLLFQTFSFLFLACDSKLDKWLINLKTLPRIYWIPELRFSGSQRSLQPQTPVKLLPVVRGDFNLFCKSS